jgi:hypothetical protein
VGGSQSENGKSYAHHYRKNHCRQNYFHMGSPHMSSFFIWQLGGLADEQTEVDT